MDPAIVIHDGVLVRREPMDVNDGPAIELAPNPIFPPAGFRSLDATTAQVSRPLRATARPQVDSVGGA